jgi:hypothetical protein
MLPEEIGRKIALLIDYSRDGRDGGSRWSPEMVRELSHLADELIKMPYWETSFIVGNIPRDKFYAADVPCEEGPCEGKPDPNRQGAGPLDARRARSEIQTLLAKQKESLAHTNSKIFQIMAELSGDGNDAPDRR